MGMRVVPADAHTEEEEYGEKEKDGALLGIVYGELPAVSGARVRNE